MSDAPPPPGSAAASSAAGAVAALVAVQVLFGINYVVSKSIMEQFPPLMWASLRAIAAAVALVAIAIATGRPRPAGGWRAFYLPLAWFALLGVVLNQGLFMLGLHYTTPTNSAILNTLIPVFTLLIVTVRRVEPLTVNRLLGFAAAFAGVLVLRRVETMSFSDTTLIGDVLTLCNGLSYAAFLTMSKRFVETQDPIWFTAWLFVFGAIGLTVVAIPDYRATPWPSLTSATIAGIAFAILGATVVAYLLNVWALARTRSTSVALFIYLQPVVVAVLAWQYRGEAITLRTVLASVLIFAGLLLGISRGSRTLLPATSAPA